LPKEKLSEERHADISSTMDVYAEATEKKKKEVITDMHGLLLEKRISKV